MIVYPNPLNVNQGMVTIKFYTAKEEAIISVKDVLGAGTYNILVERNRIAKPLIITDE